MCGLIWTKEYGSIPPHELVMKAMDFFNIPQKVKDLMRNYYDNFKMRFTVGGNS